MTDTIYEAVCQRGVKITATDCYEYQGAVNGPGYPIIGQRGKKHGVHRIVLAEKLGRPLEAQETARHTCDNPPCINPAHLIPGTQADNLSDMRERGRAWWQGATHCPNGHAYAADSTPDAGGHRCGQCIKDRKRRFYLRQKAAGRV